MLSQPDYLGVLSAVCPNFRNPNSVAHVWNMAFKGPVVI